VIGHIDEGRLKFHQVVQQAEDIHHASTFEGGRISNDIRVLPLDSLK
jgi:hypothetical protein